MFAIKAVQFDTFNVPVLFALTAVDHPRFNALVTRTFLVVPERPIEGGIYFCQIKLFILTTLPLGILLYLVHFTENRLARTRASSSRAVFAFTCVVANAGKLTQRSQCVTKLIMIELVWQKF